MEHEAKNRLPSATRYPLYMVGLLIMVLGGLLAHAAGVDVYVQAAVEAVGFLFLVLSVALR